HPLFLSFVPGAPTESSVLFDLVVAASNIYGGSWLEGAGAVYAENEALRWLSDLAGMPASAGGVFVSGGTAGNLSALLAARWRWRHRANGALDAVRPIIVTSVGSHSSVGQAARVMDADVISVAADERGRLCGEALSHTLDSMTEQDRARISAIVATAGTTNAGVVDDLDAASAQARRFNTWFHVDGAYGAAALCAPSVRHLFSGIEHADSLIVDPHKWLFGPYDCCALIYRDPTEARHAHTQHAEYLDVLEQDENKVLDAAWNPADLAHHLTRRARGLPFWFSLAMHGTDAYTDAMEATLTVTRQGAELIRRAPHTELVLEPELSILVFRRLGWTPSQYQEWSDRTLESGLAFVVPSSWNGETVLRFCIVNPRTTVEGLSQIIDSLK
ncbi:MAG: aminotransferase class V-fold PLP-dependent enzyme, partial [Actinomycetota bacterium]